MIETVLVSPLERLGWFASAINEMDVNVLGNDIAWVDDDCAEIFMYQCDLRFVLC